MADDRFKKLLDEAEEQLRKIESSLKRVLTQVENSSIETSTKSALVADLEEILTEVHHLVPVVEPSAEFKHGPERIRDMQVR